MVCNVGYTRYRAGGNKGFTGDSRRSHDVYSKEVSQAALVLSLSKIFQQRNNPTEKTVGLYGLLAIFNDKAVIDF